MKKWNWLCLLALVGCAGMERDCSSGCATKLGADWIVLQYGFDGTPINCWKLKDVAISNEAASDGIFWLAPEGHLVHISGWYNRVQVDHGDFTGAAQLLGIDQTRCKGGSYAAPRGSVTP